MTVAATLANLVQNRDTFRDATRLGNVKVIRSLLGPAWRGFVQRAQRDVKETTIDAKGTAHFSWVYEQEREDFLKLYRAAKASQWDGDGLPWAMPVDPTDESVPLIPDEWMPMRKLDAWGKLTRPEQLEQKRRYLSWILSQFLHGEQGALFAATQVTQAVPWFEGKLYGATQVMDEARHLEVFHRYLSQKLERTYQIDDNLYVIIDALMSDARFDLKFLGMQIMIEGLALGAFGVYRSITKEPLLKELLKNVITDEARHVTYGVLALRTFNETLSPTDRREREDWAFELTLLMRNRFLLHEYFDENWGHVMTRRQWDAWVLDTPMMAQFRKTMFSRIIPNLRRIGLLSDRMRPHYAQIGLLDYETGKDATELTGADMLKEEAPAPY